MDFAYLIQKRINSFIKYNLDNYSKSIDMHNSIQKFLVNLAGEYSFVGESEAKVIKYQLDKNGYIDVLWKGPNKIIAFEIDSSVSRKSMFKLCKIPAVKRIWISCRYEKCKKLLREQGLSDMIYIIPIFDYRSYYRRKIRASQ